tara:strand:- start:650 stop:835 length:186 start_codon:yes stop_codon:yes gene_type:complete
MSEEIHPNLNEVDEEIHPDLDVMLMDHVDYKNYMKKNRFNIKEFLEEKEAQYKIDEVSSDR